MSDRLFLASQLARLVDRCCVVLGLLVVAALVGVLMHLAVLGVATFVGLGLLLWLTPATVDRARSDG
jgi:hypothetical protein